MSDDEPKFILYVETKSFEVPASEIWIDPEEMPENPSAEDALAKLKEEHSDPSSVIGDMGLLEGGVLHIDGGTKKGAASMASWDPENE